MNELSARSRKGWETRKAMEIARGYGPDGDKRGSQRHKVKSFAEIAERVRVAAEKLSGDSPLLSPEARMVQADGGGLANATVVREHCWVNPKGHKPVIEPAD